MIASGCYCKECKKAQEITILRITENKTMQIKMVCEHERWFKLEEI
jgi:hypothetical protein